jgi:mannose-6-phosphate isomerase
MSTSHDLIKQKISELLDRNEKGAEKSPEIDLVRRLSTQFPGDVGIWSVYFLQHFTLQPGEALFLPANEPHAYLYGGIYCS